MKKNKKSYENYVCPHCFRQLQECICEHFPPWELIFIDKHIQPVIQVLNDKGYKTTGCCESHIDGDCHNIYVTFNIKQKFDTLPAGYKYIKQGYGISYEYPRNTDAQKFEELKNDKLAELLRWAQEL